VPSVELEKPGMPGCFVGHRFTSRKMMDSPAGYRSCFMFLNSDGRHDIWTSNDRFGQRIWPCWILKSTIFREGISTRIYSLGLNKKEKDGCAQDI
jgi:hypothetical protein